MTTPTTPGPWRLEDDQVVGEGGFVIATVSSADDFPCLGGGEEEENLDAECRANAALMAAAPAYALAWLLVPEEIKGRIFDALHKPDTEWVAGAIARVEGRVTS